MKNTMLSITTLLALAAFVHAGEPSPTMFDVLYGSANFKRVEQLNDLIKQGADVNAPIGFNRRLLEGEDQSAALAAGTLKPTAWPLDIAVRQVQEEMVEILLANGAELHGGELAAAAFIGHHDTSLAMVTSLLAAGGDPNSSSVDGFTPLFWACYRGNADLVELLLSQPGIKLDQTTVDGDTALIAAVEHGHAKIVEMLLKAGALTSHTNSRGESATLAKKNVEKQQAIAATLQSYSK